MRLDKFLCEMNIGTRSQVKTYVRQGMVTVNGIVAQKADDKINENTDCIIFRGEELHYSRFQYFMLNKPQDVVSATRDNHDKTVMELLPEDARKDLAPVGRLDKDTEGLLLITNDGELSHRLLSPKKHVDKVYLVQLAEALSKENILKLEQGVDIGEEKLTLPAKVEVLKEREILLTIHEGKFHQVKRMLQAVDNEVVFLKRICFGSLSLDETLVPGECRELTTQEVAALYEQ